MGTMGKSCYPAPGKPAFWKPRRGRPVLRGWALAGGCSRPRTIQRWLASQVRNQGRRGQVMRLGTHDG
jgi:hypothetical protein